MDEEKFKAFMRKNKKSERVVKRYTSYVKAFEEHMRGKGNPLEKATPDDMREFAHQQNKKGAQYLWGIKVYSEYIGDKHMEMAAHELIGEQYMMQYSIKDFQGISPEYAGKLASLKIKSSKDMLEAGRTRKAREELSEKTGIPLESIMELVNLSDLSRIPGVKTVRARLYYDAGIDTLEKLAAQNPEEMREMLIKFIEQTGFDGMAPLPKEAASAVETARYLPKVVEH